MSEGTPSSVTFHADTPTTNLPTLRKTYPALGPMKTTGLVGTRGKSLMGRMIQRPQRGSSQSFG